MMNNEEYPRLLEDIKDNGLVEPIVIYEGKVLDGRNRYKACRELGIEVESQDYTGDDPLKYVISKNLTRRHLNESQRSMVAARLANMRQGERTDLEPSANLPNVISQSEAAETLNIGDRSLRYANQVIESGTPELIKAVDDGKVAVSLAAQATRLSGDKQVEFVEEIENGIRPRDAMKKAKKADTIEQPVPTDKYRVIYADPPWKYSDERDGNTTGAEDHYRTMTIDEICALPIKEMADDNAVLFLWVTSPLLEECFAVVREWGFKYKSSFVWDKVKHNMGHYNSVRHELLLIATRGSCLPDNRKLLDSVQVVERSNIHSEKPELFREIIDELYLYGKRIELFARKSAEGWNVWGNEVSMIIQ